MVPTGLSKRARRVLNCYVPLNGSGRSRRVRLSSARTIPRGSRRWVSSGAGGKVSCIQPRLIPRPRPDISARELRPLDSPSKSLSHPTLSLTSYRKMYLDWPFRYSYG